MILMLASSLHVRMVGIHTTNMVKTSCAWRLPVSRLSWFSGNSLMKNILTFFNPKLYFKILISIVFCHKDLILV